ncbi:TMEM175 family protein [Enterococcus cecorum]
MLSYLYIGIYWNNHHHLISTLEKVSEKFYG